MNHSQTLNTLINCKKIWQLKLNDRYLILLLTIIGSPFLIVSDLLSIVCCMNIHNKLSNIDGSVKSSRDK